MAVLFSDGFESGDVSAWDGNYGNEVIVDTPIHHGVYSMRIPSSGAGVYMLLGNDPLYLRWYFRRAETPSSDATLCQIADGAYSYIVKVELDTSNVVQLVAPSGTYSSGQTLDVDTWYCLEVLRKIGDGDGEAKLWINGVLKVEKTDETILNNSYEIDVGPGWSADVDSYNDCVVMADAHIGCETVVPVIMNHYKRIHTIIRG
jgi:hypothetical protein